MDPGSMLNLDDGHCTCTHQTNVMKPLDRRKQRIQKLDRCKSHSLVGTPNFIAPEVLRSRSGQGGYNQSCDWWSVGVIFHEMIIGRPPFCDEKHDNAMTQYKILNWKDYLKIPEDQISKNAADLIRALICEAGDRLGNGKFGVDEIKNHCFFNISTRIFPEGVDFDRIRSNQAPWKPQLQNEIDTSNFENYACSVCKKTNCTDDHIDVSDNNDSSSGFDRSNFAGFTFKRHDFATFVNSKNNSGS